MGNQVYNIHHVRAMRQLTGRQALLHLWIYDLEGQY